MKVSYKIRILINYEREKDTKLLLHHPESDVLMFMFSVEFQILAGWVGGIFDYTCEAFTFFFFFCNARLSVKQTQTLQLDDKPCNCVFFGLCLRYSLVVLGIKPKASSWTVCALFTFLAPVVF